MFPTEGHSVQLTDCLLHRGPSERRDTKRSSPCSTLSVLAFTRWASLGLPGPSLSLSKELRTRWSPGGPGPWGYRGQGRKEYSNIQDLHEPGTTWAELGLDGKEDSWAQ